VEAWVQKKSTSGKMLHSIVKVNIGLQRPAFGVLIGGNACSSLNKRDALDNANEPDATSISDRGLFCLLAGNLSPGVFRLLQQNLPGADIRWLTSRLAA
jgi:hypothetical protein